MIYANKILKTFIYMFVLMMKAKNGIHGWKPYYYFELLYSESPRENKNCSKIVIVESHSDWNSPIIFVPKLAGQFVPVRICEPLVMIVKKSESEST